MHKKPLAGKKTAARVDLQRPPRGLPARAATGTSAGIRAPSHTTRSVQDVLSSGRTLRQVARVAYTQHSWLRWLREQLPADLAAHVVSVVPRPAIPFGAAAARAMRSAVARGFRQQRPAIGELVVFADSAAWCARLRYVLAGLHEALRARDMTLEAFTVRVGRPGSLPEQGPGDSEC